ncbi:MAG: cation:dicarboxylate symporter family transporter [Crocinitomicaceae bacterium]|jgi:aerobic C4-dicarboxylate transport protein
MAKIFKHLTFYVFIAIIAGILLGHFNPSLGEKMELIGKGFISIIKVFVGPIIFLTIVLGISSMGDLKKVGRIGLKSLIYFELVTTFALGLGVFLAVYLEPGNIDRNTLTLSDATKYTSNAHQAFSWLKFLQDNFTIQVLIISILTGIIVSRIKQREYVVERLDRVSKFVFKLLKYVMYLAPLGAFGGMAFAVGKFGLHTLIPLGKLVGSVYMTMLLFVILGLGMIMRFYKLNIFKFLRYIREELLIVLGTSSSESALPNLMLKLEKLGCKKSVVGLVVPTGYSFNLDGTSIYLSMSVIFIAQLYGVQLSISEILLIIGILMLTSKGAAGVTGSGFVVLASTLSSLNKIPLEGLAFLLGVDKFLSEARAITNIIGNGVATLVIAKSENEFDESLYYKEVENS